MIDISAHSLQKNKYKVKAAAAYIFTLAHQSENQTHIMSQIAYLQ